MWLPILKKGQTAMGRTGIIHADDQTLNAMAARYDPRFHEAPVVIGRAEEADPAFGWVKSLAVRNGCLHADARINSEQITDDLTRGTRRVSRVAFYPDLNLRHVSLSGEKLNMFGLAAAFACGDDGAMITFAEDGQTRGEDDQAIREVADKVIALLENPPEYDQYGRKWSSEPRIVKDYVDHVLAKNPAIQQDIAKLRHDHWAEHMRRFVLAVIGFSEQTSPAAALKYRALATALEKGWTFREALSDACLKDPAGALLHSMIEGGKSARRP